MSLNGVFFNFIRNLSIFINGDQCFSINRFTAKYCIETRTKNMAVANLHIGDVSSKKVKDIVSSTFGSIIFIANPYRSYRAYFV